MEGRSRGKRDLFEGKGTEADRDQDNGRAQDKDQDKELDKDREYAKTVSREVTPSGVNPTYDAPHRKFR